MKLNITVHENYNTFTVEFLPFDGVFTRLFNGLLGEVVPGPKNLCLVGVKAGDKVNQIKELRTITDWGLRESKDAIEALEGPFPKEAVVFKLFTGEVPKTEFLQLELKPA